MKAEAAAENKRVEAEAEAAAAEKAAAVAKTAADKAAKEATEKEAAAAAEAVNAAEAAAVAAKAAKEAVGAGGKTGAGPRGGRRRRHGGGHDRQQWPQLWGKLKNKGYTWVKGSGASIVDRWCVEEKRAEKKRDWEPILPCTCVVLVCCTTLERREMGTCQHVRVYPVQSHIF